MKYLIIVLLLLLVVAAGGYVYVKNVQKTGDDSTQIYKTESITRTGVLQKSSVAGTDYNHILLSEGVSYGVVSQKVNLDEYVGKTVEATGQNSGTTLYIDELIEK